MDPIRAQYESLPYPTRDPADEANRLITGSPSHLDEINHYVFGGQLDFAAPFHALVAGGGTGDATIMLAQQMADRDMPGRVVYLDLSTASREIAEARAKVRGLTNIEFHTGSLLEAGEIAPGPFDYIDCCGVLHHLPDPDAGLAGLTPLLRDGGGMGIMVYGTLGRTGVYPMQDVLRSLVAGEATEKQISLTRDLLETLPETNWLKRNDQLRSLDPGDDAGLYDLLLHAEDRAYTVPEIVRLCENSGLVLTGFLEPARYDPQNYLNNDELRARARKLHWIEAAGVAENLAGNLKTHSFYAVKGRSRKQAVAHLTGAAIPVLIAGDGPGLARNLSPEASVRAEFGGHRMSFDIDPGSAAALRYVDGKTSLKDIHKSVQRAKSGKYISWPAFRESFEKLYVALNAVNAMLLRLDRSAKT